MTDKFRCDIIRVVNEITGWCTPEKALRLCELIEETRPAVVVELGIWYGRSAIPMALALKQLGCGVIVCVDPWDALASVEGYDDANAHWWGSQDHEMAFRSFKEKADQLKLQDHVIVMRGRSDDVIVPAEINLLHIDGQHAEQAIRDVDRFASRVPAGGIVVMDDVNWQNNGVAHVAIAVHHLLEMGFGQGVELETGAIFRRERINSDCADRAPVVAEARASAPSGL